MKRGNAAKIGAVINKKYVKRLVQYHRSDNNLSREEAFYRFIAQWIKETISDVTPTSLLRALETNFNGIERCQFERLVAIFFKSISDECNIDFRMPKESEYQSSVVVLHDSMQLESTRRRLYGRYKLVIDESEDESVARFLFEEGYTKSTIYSILLTLIKNSKQLLPQQKVQQSLTIQELHDTDDNKSSNNTADFEQNRLTTSNSITFLNIHQYTQLTIKSKSVIEQNPLDLQQCLLCTILCKLLQLVSPESLVLKLPSFEDSVSNWISKIYFHDQEHFSVENFIRILTSPSDNDLQFDVLNQNNNQIPLNITTKITIFTRTNASVDDSNHPSTSTNQLLANYSKRLETINLASNSSSYKVWCICQRIALTLYLKLVFIIIVLVSLKIMSCYTSELYLLLKNLPMLKSFTCMYEMC
ncbi:unnamed protein product [Didymodactylos carnosus]|uniref:Uncharacterized protein n=1 Tax=Didymodactylos carnosus TaxID=1234261 RepID=A0A814TWQ4_9BILA|nr:unnamed protein product [Didymodactylos carnosus]CAF1167836.1 unnamed protein product [Didymodactylos carnosus]CAF3757053.1 unnamed protein product [Didymodactylos carnosus]CAF3931472.1 unnamed protein product [Didymodactylos carnosus]